MQEFDVVVIGAGAAGLFCAGVAGQLGVRALLLDHHPKMAEKIRISGGGRCNFTNLHTAPANFLGDNPHFCRSALSRYTPGQFVDLLKRHGISFHEKHRGQLFCDKSAQDVIVMLLAECALGSVTHWQPCAVAALRSAPGGNGYELDTARGSVNSQSLLSIKEEKHDPLGNIPMELKIADLHLIKESDAPNARLVPRSVDLHLESWTDPARRDSTFLTFATQGRLNSSGKYTYSIDLVCGLKELFDTDVGKRLKLDETLGGGIEGHAELIVDATQGFGIDARINGRNTFVMVPIPEDVAKPAGKRRMMKQPLPLSFDCFIDARQAEGGGIAYIDVQRFLLDASTYTPLNLSRTKKDLK